MIREWNEESLDHRNTLLYAMGISEEEMCIRDRGRGVFSHFVTELK